MSGDVLYPLLIGGGCILLVGIVHLLTRPRPSRADIHVPEGPITGNDSIPPRASATALTAWHQANEARVLDFIEFYDRATLGPEPNDDAAEPSGNPEPNRDPEPNDTNLDPEPNDDEAEHKGDPEHHYDTAETNRDPEHHQAAEEVGRALDAAGEAHPAPDMHAELAALRAAAEAMSEANERGDLDAQERHRVLYDAYRAAWLERLWQFAIDRDRVLQMRTLQRTD